MTVISTDITIHTAKTFYVYTSVEEANFITIFDESQYTSITAPGNDDKTTERVYYH